MSGESKNIKIMQFLGLDYSEAINSTEDLIGKLGELDNALDKIEKSGSRGSSGGASKTELDKLEKELKVLKEKAKVTDTYYLHAKSLQLEETARIKANSEELLKEAESQREIARALSERREELERLYSVKRDEIREDYIGENGTANENEIANRINSNEQLKKIKADILSIENETKQRLRDQEVLEARITEQAQIKSKAERALEESQLISKTRLNLAEIERLDKSKLLTNAQREAATQLKEQLSTIEKMTGSNETLSASDRERLNSLKKQTDILKDQSKVELLEKDARGSLIGEEFKRRVGWFVSGSIWSTMVQGMRGMLDDMKDVETGMMEISRVMNDANYNALEFRNSLMKIGHDYGYTFQDMQSIATRWAQSGYNANEVLKLTKNSLLALNVAELDSKQATEGLIAIMQQWNLKAEQSETLIDKINKTADSFPVTSQDIVDGLQKMGSTAKNANLTLDETIAVLVAMKSASGATGKEVGNAAKSILSYVQRAASINTFESLGINVFADEAKTQFRNVLDIFNDISKKWSSASDEIKDGFVKSADEAGLFNEELATALGMTEEFNDLNKRDLSQASAGVFRRNYFISLIENMTQTKDVLQELQDVEGYSRRENAQAMETEAKRIEQVKNSFQQLKLTIADSGLLDALKVMLSAGDEVLGVLNKIPAPVVEIITKLAMLDVTLKGLSTGISYLSKFESLNNITNKVNIVGLSKDLDNLKSSFYIFTNGLRAGKGVMDSVKDSFNYLTAGANGLEIGLGTVTIAITALVGAYKLISKAIDDYKNRFKNALEEQDKAIQNYIEQETSLNKLNRTYDEFIRLSDKEKQGQINSKEKERLLEIQKELVSVYGLAADGIDDEGNAYARNSEKIRENIAQKEKDLEYENQKIVNIFKKNETLNGNGYQKAKNDLDLYSDKVLETQKEMDALRSKILELESTGKYNDGYKADYFKRDYEIMEASYQKYIKGRMDAQKELDDYETQSKIIATMQMKEYIKNAKRMGKEFTEEQVANTRVFIENAKLAGETFDEINAKVVKSLETPKFEIKTSGVDAVAESLKKIGISYSDLVLNADKANAEIEKTEEEAQNTSGALRNLSGQLVVGQSSYVAIEAEVLKLANTYEELVKIQSDLANGSLVTESNLRTLSDVFPELMNKTDLNSDALQQFLSQALATREGFIKSQLDMTATTALNSDERIKSLVKEMQAWAEFLNGVMDSQKASQLIAQNAIVGMNENKGRASFDSEPTLNDYQKVQRVKAKYNSALKEVNGIVNSTSNNINASIDKVINKLNSLVGTGNKAAKSQGSAGKARESAQKAENTALKEALQLLDRRSKLEEQNTVTALRDLNELKRIKAELALTDDERFDLDVRIMEQEKRYYSLRLEHSKNWIEEQKRLRIFNLEDEISAWERIKAKQGDYLEAMKEAESQLYELRKRLRDKNLADEENYIGRLKKVSLLSVGEEINMYESLYEKIGADSEDEQFDRIENLYGLYHSRIDEIFKEIDNNHNNAIKSMRDSLRNSPINDELKVLDSQLKSLRFKKQEADNLKQVEEAIKRLRELREDARALGMDTRGLFADLPTDYLNMLDGALSDEEKLERIHKERVKELERQGKVLADLKQREIDDINRQIKVLEDLEAKERKEKELAKLNEELEYYKVRTSEDARKKVKELEEKINELIAEDNRKTEKEKLKDKADKLSEEKKLIEDKYKDEQKRLESEFGLEKKIRDEIAKLRKDGKEYSIQLEIDRLNDYKAKLEEEKRLEEERLQEEISRKEEQYKILQGKFTDYMKNVIALSGSLSKDAFNEWMVNYIVPMQNALSRGDYNSAMDYMNGAGDYAERKNAENRDYYSRESIDTRSNNRVIYELAKRIVDLKRDWEMYNSQGNETGKRRVNAEANRLRDKLSQYDAQLAQLLLNSGLKESERILARLPKYHNGGEVLTDGIAALKKNEIILTPEFSREFKALRQVILNNPPSNVTNNNKTEQSSRVINIDSILKTDDVKFTDRREKDDVIKQIARTIKSL